MKKVGGMVRFRSNFINGVQHFLFNNGFRQLALYSSSISAEVNPKFFNFLVENLGFSKQQALSTSSKLTRYRIVQGAKKVNNFNSVKAESVITFLEKLGLQKSQIRNSVAIEPRILLAMVEKSLTRKIEIFEKLGFPKPVIADLITVNPSLFFSAWSANAIPIIQALRHTMGSEDYLISLLKKLRYIHLPRIPNCLVPNVALLQTYDIHIDSIRKAVIREPFPFLRETEYFRDALIRVEETWGIDRTSPRFLAGVAVLSSTTEKTIESKKQVYKSFGWSDSDVISLVMLCPALLALSEETIKKKLDFLMNVLGYKPSELASKCTLFTCSLEKRVVPRHKVLVVLKEKGLIRENYALDTAIVYTEPGFVKKFVLPFKEVHELYSKHAGVCLEMLNLGSSKPKL